MKYSSLTKSIGSLFCIYFLLFCSALQAQTKSKVYLEYIDLYANLAVSHMDQYKIPASITLAQGILESGAGRSSFVKESNNHFGIKCHTDWKGERLYRKDDGPNDCFRKYKKAEESFEDHSKFLKQHQRYAVLFTYNIRDYKAWAKGLQTCGYATDKAYANKLIKLIEDYELYRYDTKSPKGSDKKKKVEEPTSSVPKMKRDVFKTHGLIYVVADSDDSFDKIAYDLDFKAKDLTKYNEVPEDFPLYKGDIVYLEKKKKKADKPYYEHIVRIGESMHSISQKYGIQLKQLYKMNKKNSEYVPEEGDVLRLR
jgi:Muramidase (flagellum-specific)